MNVEPMPEDKIKTALQVAASILEAIRPYCLIDLTTKYGISHKGHKLGSFTIDEALDIADAALGEADSGRFDLSDHLEHQREWSDLAFGPGLRTEGVSDHIRKELIEVAADPCDLAEWIDVVILALDGATRCARHLGLPMSAVVDGIIAKQAKNEARQWPDWRTADPNKAIEHVRGEADHG